MVHNHTPYSQDRLRAAIQEDLDGTNGSPRTGAAIVRALNAHLEATGRAQRKIIEVENTERYIRNFARRRGALAEVIQELLWDLYEYERRLVIITPGAIDRQTMTRLLDEVYECNEPLSTSSLVGKFLIYKKSIKDPTNLIVRGLIEFKKTETDALSVEEVHINRSHTPADKIDIEFWIGSLLPRSRSYCLVTREKELGTPKFAVLEMGHKEGTRAITFWGRSLECIEKWGGGAVFESGVFLQRLNDNFNYLEDNSLLDLVLRSELHKTHSDIITALG
jgi:hypothetical protein